MHLQPLYAGCACYGGGVAEDLFRRGICLPSSSSLSLEDQIHVINQVRAAARAEPIYQIERAGERAAGAALRPMIPGELLPLQARTL
jgi:hypothetical protein